MEEKQKALLHSVIAKMNIEQGGFAASVVDRVNVTHYRGKEQIISLDDTSASVFLVLSGSARALIYSEDGNEVWFNDFAAGDFFGEMAAIVPSDRTANIYSTGALTVAKFSAEEFIDLMRANGAFSLYVTKQIVTRFRRTSDRMYELSVLSAPGRVYAELLRIAKPNPKRPSDQLLIESMPAMTELARRVNSTRETVSRTISNLEQRGLISRADRKTAVISPEVVSFVAS